MAIPVLSWALRASLRRADSVLRTTRDLADLGITAVELVGQALGVEADPGPIVAPMEPRWAPAPVDAEVGIAEPGYGNGAGDPIRIAPPFDGYDAPRAADVIARLPGSDAVTLGAIELYESTHRRRRTVLDAVTRQARRRDG
jgi:hypothetical protein